MSAGFLPTLSGPTVDPQQGPVVFQNIETNPDMFGAAQGRALEMFGKGISSLSGLFDGLQDKQNQSDILTRYSGAKDKIRDYLYNSDNGLYNKKSGEARGAYQNFIKFSDDLMSSEEGELKDPKSRETFKKMWLNERDTMADGVFRFEAAETHNFSIEAQKAVIKSASETAAVSYNDPEVIRKSVDDVRRAIRASNIGQPIDAVKQLEQEAESSIYSQVVIRAAMDDPTRASELLGQYKDKLNPSDFIQTSKALAPALKKDQVSRAYTGITSGGTAANELTKIQPNAKALVTAMAGAESNFDSSAESDKGASGVMQVMPDTARDISIRLGDGLMEGKTDDEIKGILKDPETTIGLRYGVYYMQKQLETFDGDLEASLIAYNAGPQNAKKFLAAGRDYSALPKPEETRPYVDKIMTRFMETTGGSSYGNVPNHLEVAQGGLPAAGTKMHRDDWSLKFYKPDDILPPTGSGQFVDARSATMVDNLGAMFFEKYGKRISINEPYDPKGNTAGRRRGTASVEDNPHVNKSRHLVGQAFDLQIQKLSDEEKADLLGMARQLGFTGVGFYEEGSGHLHVDTGRERNWGRIPAWALSTMDAKIPPRKFVPGGVSQRKVQVADNEPAPLVSNQPTAFIGSDGGVKQQNIIKVNSQSASLEDWLSQADGIDDEEVKASVKSKLTVEWNRRQAAEKEQTKELEGVAWKYVEEGGVESIPPNLRSQLSHEFINSAMTFEEKMSNRDKIQTDYSVWYDLNRMTDAEIIDLDLMKYRPVLDNEHFDKMTNRQAELLRKRENPKKSDIKIDGLRTRTQIVDDTVAAAGIDKKTKAAQIGRLESQLDKNILAFYASNAREPNQMEIQTMVDRLLISGKGYFFGSSRAVDVYGNKEEASIFRAAETPDQIPTADYDTVVEKFRQVNQRGPSNDEVVVTYNKAMQAFLGADVEIPVEIKNEFQSGLEKAKGRKVSEEEVQHYYNRYLIKFLGL